MARGLRNQGDYIIQRNETYKERIQSAPQIEVRAFVPFQPSMLQLYVLRNKIGPWRLVHRNYFSQKHACNAHKHQHYWRWVRGRLWISKKLMLRMLFSNICEPTIQRRCGPKLSNAGKQSPLITRDTPKQVPRLCNHNKSLPAISFRSKCTKDKKAWSFFLLAPRETNQETYLPSLNKI